MVGMKNAAGSTVRNDYGMVMDYVRGMMIVSQDWNRTVRFADERLVA